MNNAGHAICSLICPGLGQACQGRKLDGACPCGAKACSHKRIKKMMGKKGKK